MSEQGKRPTMAGGGSAAESPASSCVSSDAEDEVVVQPKPMVVVGCPQCLMYVMLSGEEQQPKCPRCKSPVLLHFLRAGGHGGDDINGNLPAGRQ